MKSVQTKLTGAPYRDGLSFKKSIVKMPLNSWMSAMVLIGGINNKLVIMPLKEVTMNVERLKMMTIFSDANAGPNLCKNFDSANKPSSGRHLRLYRLVSWFFLSVFFMQNHSPHRSQAVTNLPSHMSIGKTA